jgi:hypothetical protein
MNEMQPPRAGRRGEAGSYIAGEGTKSSAISREGREANKDACRDAEGEEARGVCAIVGDSQLGSEALRDVSG